MKKIIAVLLIMMFLPVGAFADAVLPAVLTEPLLNYTGDYDISLSLDNSEELVSLLKEMSRTDENNINLETFLKTLLSFEGKMKLRSDIDNNYEDIKLSLVTESTHNIDVNQNLSLGIEAEQGIWISAELYDSSSSFNIIYTGPAMNKYVTLSDEDILGENELTPDKVKYIKSIFNKYYIENLNKKSAEILMKYATYKASGTKHSIYIDNDAFTAFLNELVLLAGQSASGIPEQEEKILSADEIPDLSGYKVLGDKGIKIVYTVIGGKISAMEMTADISIDIPSLYNNSDSWPYAASGIIDFTVDIKADINKIGSTKVEFPYLTEDNSVSYSELYPQVYTEESYEEYEEYVEYEEYPSFYASGVSTKLPVSEEDIYFPLRQTLESAYGDYVHIEYADGIITASCEFFPGFTTLNFDVASNKFYTDNKEHIITPSVLSDGITYVNSKLFTDIFSWSLDYAHYDFLDRFYYYGFFTNITY